jgi:hypothetical protein
MLAALLARAVKTLEEMPDHSPEQETSLATMRHTAKHADSLARLIEGGQA